MDPEHPTDQNGILGIWKPSGLLELSVLFLGPLLSSFWGVAGSTVLLAGGTTIRAGG